MKIFSILNNLVEKSMYYIEFNLLLLFSTICTAWVIIIILAFYDVAVLLILYLRNAVINYLIICSILAGIFILNAIFFKKHISYNKKIPRWYKIFFWILLITNIAWHTYISPLLYDIIYNTINNIH